MMATRWLMCRYEYSRDCMNERNSFYWGDQPISGSWDCPHYTGVTEAEARAAKSDVARRIVAKADREEKEGRI